MLTFLFPKNLSSSSLLSLSFSLWLPHSHSHTPHIQHTLAQGNGFHLVYSLESPEKLFLQCTQTQGRPIQYACGSGAHALVILQSYHSDCNLRLDWKTLLSLKEWFWIRGNLTDSLSPGGLETSLTVMTGGCLWVEPRRLLNLLKYRKQPTATRNDPGSQCEWYRCWEALL